MTEPLGVARAVLSPCGRYRYALTREWGAHGNAGGDPVHPLYQPKAAQLVEAATLETPGPRTPGRILPMSKINVSVTLTAYNMGPDATEADFDSFAALVADRIDDVTGLDVEVDQFAFTGSGQSEDRIDGATDEQREAIREALDGLWQEWCSPSAATSAARLSAADVLERYCPGRTRRTDGASHRATCGTRAQNVRVCREATPGGAEESVEVA